MSTDSKKPQNEAVRKEKRRHDQCPGLSRDLAARVAPTVAYGSTPPGRVLAFSRRHEIRSKYVGESYKWEIFPRLAPPPYPTSLSPCPQWLVVVIRCAPRRRGPNTPLSLSLSATPESRAELSRRRSQPLLQSIPRPPPVRAERSSLIFLLLLYPLLLHSSDFSGSCPLPYSPSHSRFVSSKSIE